MSKSRASSNDRADRADRVFSTLLVAQIAWGEPAAAERAMRADRYNRRKAPYQPAIYPANVKPD